MEDGKPKIDTGNHIVGSDPGEDQVDPPNWGIKIDQKMNPFRGLFPSTITDSLCLLSHFSETWLE